MKNKISIKDLTKSLKDKKPIGNPISEKPEGKSKITEKMEKKKPGKKVEKKAEKTFSGLKQEFENANATDYDLSGVVHIDRDIHEVLTKLKSATGLKIGRYISYKLEYVIRENLEEISEMLNSSNKNKFLD